MEHLGIEVTSTFWHAHPAPCGIPRWGVFFSQNLRRFRRSNRLKAGPSASLVMWQVFFTSCARCSGIKTTCVVFHIPCFRHMSCRWASRPDHARNPAAHSAPLSCRRRSFGPGDLWWLPDRPRNLARCCPNRPSLIRVVGIGIVGIVGMWDRCSAWVRLFGVQKVFNKNRVDPNLNHQNHQKGLNNIKRGVWLRKRWN